MIHNFKANRPYKIVEVWDNGIKYKITQPIKWLFFGYSEIHHDVTYKKPYDYDKTLHFESKDFVDRFIKSEIEKFNHKETVVYDSQKK